MQNKYHTHKKVRSQRSLVNELKRLRKKPRRVVFANGCFDVLHVGHIKLLQYARSLGDILIVAINSDRSVRTNKGPGRPVVKQRDRAEVLSALACVDYVIVFNTPTPLSLIKALIPDVLVKGADWKGNAIVGSDVVLANGGKIIRVPVLKGYSSTKLIQRLPSC